MFRDDELTFCTNNNGTLMYRTDKDEQDILESSHLFSFLLFRFSFAILVGELLITIYQLFHYQRNLPENDAPTCLLD